MAEQQAQELYIDPILKKELDRIKRAVINKDRDYVLVIDGEEGSGKSVLAMQIAAYLDPQFNANKLCFNADQFIDTIKHTSKYSCVVLDEAFSASSSRASLTEVNRAMVGIGTEMRQQNLFVIMVIPSFFDLDKYYALWRCKALIHVYFTNDGGRGRYYIFPKTAKKLLYLNGKRFYNYTKPKSPFPVCRFTKFYPIDERLYRTKKAEAFKKRVVSSQARKWKKQRDALINEMYHNLNIKSIGFERIFIKWGTKPIGQREVQKILQLYQSEEIGSD